MTMHSSPIGKWTTNKCTVEIFRSEEGLQARVKDKFTQAMRTTTRIKSETFAQDLWESVLRQLSVESNFTNVSTEQKTKVSRTYLQTRSQQLIILGNFTEQTAYLTRKLEEA